MTSMSFAEAVRMCLTAKYATFSGRARRAEYWWFSLLYVIAAGAVLGISFAMEAPLLSVFLLPFAVPMLSVSIRRLHDTGKPGWRMFVALIPAVGRFLYLVATGTSLPRRTWSRPSSPSTSGGWPTTRKPPVRGSPQVPAHWTS